jgi:TIR domain-containing protein
MIAISYRREDSAPITGRIYDRLQAVFGRDRVFLDFDSIPFGVDFRTHISETLSGCQTLLVVIGPHWFGVSADGSRRIDDPEDFVRLEVARALARDIRVIPLLIDRTEMPSSTVLPDDLKSLTFRNALRVDSGADFHHHIDRLCNSLQSTPISPTPTVSSSPQPIPSTSPPHRIDQAPRHEGLELLAESARQAGAQFPFPDFKNLRKILLGSAVGIVTIVLFGYLGWGNLLNLEVIKAAATSTLGILSLICLIVGIVSLGLFRNSPVWAKLLVFLIMLGGVFGFGTSVLREQNQRPAAPEASRDYMIGRWQIEQASAGLKGGTFIDFDEDGRFTGEEQAFTNGEGNRRSISGVWQFEKLGKDQFRLIMTYDDGRPQWKGTYRIWDHDRRFNIDENWVAVRVPR